MAAAGTSIPQSWGQQKPLLVSGVPAPWDDLSFSIFSFFPLQSKFWGSGQKNVPTQTRKTAENCVSLQWEGA